MSEVLTELNTTTNNVATLLEIACGRGLRLKSVPFKAKTLKKEKAA